jgi:predicted alpha/beta hydrolase
MCKKMSQSLFRHLIIPASLATLKYLPAAFYGGKYNLHHNIALDWSNWAKNRNGVLGIVEGAKQAYSDFAAPTCFLSFHDDQLLAPYTAVDEIYDSYGSSVKQHIHIQKKNLHQKNIGQFNFFKEEYSYLWENVTQWFKQHSQLTYGQRKKGVNRKNRQILNVYNEN